MNTLEIPQDVGLQAAVGRVAMRHGQLDYVLRLTVKTLTSASVREALDATDGKLSIELRKMVRDYAKKKTGGDPTVLTKLDAILNRARRATNDRNETLHRIYAYDSAGNPVVKGDDHRWGPIPTAADLDGIADSLAELAIELNTARLAGFLFAALNPGVQSVDPPYDRTMTSPPGD